MFWALLWSSVCFFTADIALNVANAMTTSRPWLIALLRQSLEMLTAIAIGWAFRPRPLNALFEQARVLPIAYDCFRLRMIASDCVLTPF